MSQANERRKKPHHPHPVELRQKRLLHCTLSVITLWWFHMQIMHHIFPPSRHRHLHRQQPKRTQFVVAQTDNSNPFNFNKNPNQIPKISIVSSVYVHGYGRVCVCYSVYWLHPRQEMLSLGNLIATGCCQNCNVDDRIGIEPTIPHSTATTMQHVIFCADLHRQHELIESNRYLCMCVCVCVCACL